MISAAERRRVWLRAGGRCEYCRLHQSVEPFPRFHVEHIIARKHFGSDNSENLALSCHYCNLGKSSNLSGIDPESGQIVQLFHPRRQSWHRHFRWVGPRLVGRTKCGRTTISVLNINHPKRVALRQILLISDRAPDSEIV